MEQKNALTYLQLLYNFTYYSSPFDLWVIIPQPESDCSFKAHKNTNAVTIFGNDVASTNNLSNVCIIPALPH